ncbi:MAG TPA: hypothetical protein VGM39_20540 [Kofleriaceae bacterium]|jgi:hypothetical protein
MKRWVLAAVLIGCAGGQHAADEPLSADQQQCMDAHTRTNAYTSMKDADRDKLDASTQQMLFTWVHDLSYQQCIEDQAAAVKVMHRQATVSLQTTDTEHTTSVVEVSQIPALAARADVVRVAAQKN